MEGKNKKKQRQGKSSKKVQEKPAEKKKAERLTFKPQFLLKPKGIKQLYSKSTKLVFDDNQLHNLAKVIKVIKQWHFNLMPKYNYEYFLDRCQAFGNTKIIQSYMNRVRRIHKGEEEWDEQIDKKIIQRKKPSQKNNNIEIESSDQDLFNHEQVNNEQMIEQKQPQKKQKENINIIQNQNLQQQENQSDIEDFNMLMKNLKEKHQAESKINAKVDGEIVFDEDGYIPSDFQQDFE